MPKVILIGVATLLVAPMTLAQSPGAAAARLRPRVTRTPMNETIPGQFLIKLRPAVASQVEAWANQASNVPVDSTVATRLSRLLGGAVFDRVIDDAGWTQWRVATVASPNRLAAAAMNDPEVLAAQPVNRVYPLLDQPNDPDYSVTETGEPTILSFGDQSYEFRRLWHLDDVDAMGGWSSWPNKWFTAASKPKTAPLIAFVDTGVDPDHPDFINTGGNTTDVAGGGQIQKSLSVSIIGGVTKLGDYRDRNGHGTHVAGIAVASGNNSKGGIGTGFNSRAMIVRVFDNQGVGSDRDAGLGIKYAVNKGADVINVSLGTRNYSQFFQDCITYAWQKGVLVVAAANEDGNGGGDLGPIYPAACSGALAVTANGPDMIPASDIYAGSGDYVGIAAPGGNYLQLGDEFSGDLTLVLQYIYSTSPTYSVELSTNPNVYPEFTPTYSYLVGTSMATPMVSGAAGLYCGRTGIRQSSFNNLRVFQAIQRSAFDSNGAYGGGWEPSQGYGSLNMGGLMTGQNLRDASLGSIRGIVYSGRTVVSSTEVTAENQSTGEEFSTTTSPDGTYHFEAMPEGLYRVTAYAFNLSKAKFAVVRAGCDVPGFDFRCGTGSGDSTVPVLVSPAITSVEPKAINFRSWGYDTETGIDRMLVKVGTSKGSGNIVAERENVIDTANNRLNTATTLPNHWYLTITYVNGAGLTKSFSAYH